MFHRKPAYRGRQVVAIYAAAHYDISQSHLMDFATCLAGDTYERAAS